MCVCGDGVIVVTVHVCVWVEGGGGEVELNNIAIV